MTVENMKIMTQVITMSCGTVLVCQNRPTKYTNPPDCQVTSYTNESYLCLVSSSLRFKSCRL